MNKLLFTLLVTLPISNSWAQIRDFQTTRLNATAGAGVASILSTEAAILNPASSAFFSGNSASYQRIKTKLARKDDLRGVANNKFASRNESQGIFLSDHSTEVKGGMAYIQQQENNFRRERIILHGAVPMSQGASMGVSYNYIQDKLRRTSNHRHQTQHQLIVGTTYIIDPDTIIALIVQDPTRTTSGEERAIAGFQYNIASRLTLIGDVGAQFTKDVSEKYLWRAAVQINIFSDFFLRAGKFYDNVTEFKGTGLGVGWIGPRFGVEFAHKVSDQIGKGSYIYTDEQLVDTSVSAIMKF